MIKTSLTVLLLASVIVVSGFPAVSFAQKKSANKTQPAPQSSSTAKKGIAETTCEGALDIVPSGSASFVRKRRPSRPPGDAVKKTEEQSPGQ